MGALGVKGRHGRAAGKSGRSFGLMTTISAIPGIQSTSNWKVLGDIPGSCAVVGKETEASSMQRCTHAMGMHMLDIQEATTCYCISRVVLQAYTRIITFYLVHELFENQSWMLKRYIVQLPCWVQTVQSKVFSRHLIFCLWYPLHGLGCIKGTVYGYVWMTGEYCFRIGFGTVRLLLVRVAPKILYIRCFQFSIYMYIYIYRWIYAFLFMHGSPWSFGQKRL